MDISIRRATAGDTKGIAKLFDDYRVFFGEPSDLPLAQDFIADRLRHTESVIFSRKHRRNGAWGLPSYIRVSRRFQQDESGF